MGILMMDSMGWPYDSFDCLSFYLGRLVFDQRSLVHPVSESMGGSLRVTKDEDGHSCV